MFVQNVIQESKRLCPEKLIKDVEFCNIYHRRKNTTKFY